MPISNEASYMRLRAELTIDPASLDAELVRMPMLVMEACECTIHAVGQRDGAKAVLEWTRADVSAKLRAASDTKLTDTATANAVLLSDEYGNADAEFEASKQDAALWTALTDALREKSRSLSKMVDLHISGYLTTASINTDRRAVINEKRQELAQRRQIVNRE